MNLTLRLTVIAVFCLLLAVSASAAPRMTIGESTFDFGYAPQNSKVTHVFWLYSTGDDTLKILNIKPGWGCTKAPLEREILAVGDSTRLEIIFSTKKYKRRMKKSPRITTNEGPPDKKVNIEVDVVQHPDSTYPLVIEPYKVDLSQFSEKKVDQREFEIANVSDQDLELTLIAAPVHMMEIDLPDKVEAGKTVKGKVTIKDEALGDSFEKSFTFELNDENGTRFTVPVKRTLRSADSKSITKVKAEKGK